MKLTVIFGDLHAVRLDLQYIGVARDVSTRVVQITLTDEQAEQLRPQYVGASGSRQVYEERISLALDSVKGKEECDEANANNEACRRGEMR